MFLGTVAAEVVVERSDSPELKSPSSVDAVWKKTVYRKGNNKSGMREVSTDSFRHILTVGFQMSRSIQTVTDLQLVHL